jgi:hypothetical protein
MGKRKDIITVPPSKRSVAAVVASKHPQKIISSRKRRKDKKTERQEAEADLNRRLNNDTDT